MQRLIEKDHFSGAVIAARNGKIVYSKAAGLAAREANIPNRLNPQFAMGSMNKMFTAVSIRTARSARKAKVH